MVGYTSVITATLILMRLEREMMEISSVCVTDLVQCCHTGVDTLGDTVLGRWIYPNGTDVPVMGEDFDFYHNRYRSVVRLHRRNDIRSPTGLYCCEVPDATSTQQTVCANIGRPGLCMYNIM